MKKNIFCFVIVFLAMALVPAYAQNKITARGAATIHKQFVDIARTKAIDEAQRNAVEKAAGVMITSTTAVENFQVKMDSILSESRGFINTYKILSEKRSGDQYEVEIEADVSAGKLRDKMTAINLIMTRKSKPRVMLIFKDSVAEAAMAKYLMNHGFKLVDAQISHKNRELEHAQDDAEARVMRGLAQHYGAEVIIVGNVEAASKSSTIYNIEMNKNTVVVTGKVINGDTGEIVTTATESKSDNKMKGDFKALTEEISTRLITRLVDEVLESWSKELADTTTVKLVVSGLNYSALQDLKAALAEEVKGFKGLNQRHFSKGKAELDLEVAGDAQGVANDLAQMSIGRRQMKITEISQNRVGAVLLP